MFGLCFGVWSFDVFVGFDMYGFVWFGIVVE